MCWMERFSLVMRSNWAVIIERFENPERMLNQLLIDMDEELESVRRGVAEALADEIQLKKKVDTARKESDEWLTRAKSAIERSDDASAEAALQQKLLATERADGLAKEYERQQQQTRKLRDSVRGLEDKIRQAKQRQTLLLARITRADSSRRINSVLDRTGKHSAFGGFQKLEAKVDRAEALEEAYDRMDGRDPDADELARQFDDKQRSERLKTELETLRQTVKP